ncbi:hypothetical protein K3495_g3381 [Podosphaera aphanis]|nr:hypothetical protein K3495_g3381 [Podosphaera aphanis]
MISSRYRDRAAPPSTTPLLLRVGNPMAESWAFTRSMLLVFVPHENAASVRSSSDGKSGSNDARSVRGAGPFVMQGRTGQHPETSRIVRDGSAGATSSGADPQPRDTRPRPTASSLGVKENNGDEVNLIRLFQRLENCGTREPYGSD